ncbi:hypothetical protein M422DRAFT_243011 [Sphaerobolus stellatus SS14]|nr:hypothetical protein M422DRAFT_243011 [Sphaerobolus stellatus SS14]
MRGYVLVADTLSLPKYDLGASSTPEDSDAQSSKAKNKTGQLTSEDRMTASSRDKTRGEEEHMSASSMLYPADQESAAQLLPCLPFNWDAVFGSQVGEALRKPFNDEVLSKELDPAEEIGK